MKKITIEIVPPTLITNPPTPPTTKIDIGAGLSQADAIQLLLSIALQMYNSLLQHSQNQNATTLKKM